MTATAAMTKKRGYLAGAIGAIGGGGPGTLTGIVVGIFYVEAFMPNAGLEGLLAPIVAAAVGGGLGTGAGTWLALKVRGHRAPGVTGLVAGGLTPFVLVGSAVASSYVEQHVLTRTDEALLFPVFACIGVVTVVAVTRSVVERRGGSDRDGPPT